MEGIIGGVLSPSEDTSTCLEVGAVGKVKGLWGREMGVKGTMSDKRENGMLSSVSEETLII